MQRHFQFLVASVFVLCGFVAATARVEAAAPTAAMTSSRFHRLYPLNKRPLRSVLSEYRLVQATLLEKSRDGAREDVSLITADGQAHSGHDDFFSSGEGSIKEVRDNYLAIQKGRMFCKQLAAKMTCGQNDPLRLGLIEIRQRLVSRVWSRDIPCPESEAACRFIKIQVGSAEHDVNTYAGYSRDPQLVGHDYELLFTIPEHVPIIYRQTDHLRIGRTETATYIFRFDQPVQKFELPNANQYIQSN